MKDYFISKRFWIRSKLVSDKILDAYTLKLFDEAHCKPMCSFYQDRPCSACDSCPCYKGTVRLYKEKEIDGKIYYGFPANNPKTLKKLFHLDSYWKIPNLRPKIPFSQKDLKFTGELRTGQVVDGIQSADQVRLCNEWLKKKIGIIVAPARTGKTILSVYNAIQLGCKTVVLAHKVDLLRQFYDAWKKTTNIKDSHIKLVKNVKELLDPKIDVALVNYQKFLSVDTMKTKRNGARKLAKYINDRFSFVVVDEVHSAGALGYYKVIMNLKCRYILGLTATPDRKDSLTTLVKQAVGPVVVEGRSMSIAPLIVPVLTHVQNHAKKWMSIVRQLCNDKKRQDIIIDWLDRDLQEGRQVIIPMQVVSTMYSLRDRIYKKLEDKYGDHFVDILNGKTDREANIKKFDAGYTKVLIASVAIIKQGIDFKSKNVNTMYNIVPMSASGSSKIGAPMHYQQTYRICSLVEGKKQPIVRWFIDDCKPSICCARSIFWKEIVPRLKDFEGQPPRYKMTDKDQLLVNDVVKRRSYYD